MGNVNFNFNFFKKIKTYILEDEENMEGKIIGI